MSIATILLIGQLYSPFALRTEPQVPQVPLVEPAKPQFPGWVAAVAAQKQPTAVFVGCSARDVAGLIVCEESKFPDVQTPCVIVALLYTDGLMHRHAVLPATATDSDIRRAAGLEVQPRSAVPFVPSRFLRPGEARRTADADRDGRGSWPTGLEFLDDLQPYRRATKTQESGNRSGFGANFVRDRTVLSMKWQVPGGLEGVQGWTSTLYKSAKARNWFGHVDPNDSPALGVWGSEITHQRMYDEGAVFADVLRNDAGSIFEVRVAEKQGGVWQRFVAYHDAAARPSGYVRPTSRQCSECHASAGTGGYGVALIPGGDTILSDPLPGVESVE